MRKSLLILAATVVCAAFVITTTTLFAEETEGTPTYVGANKCKICHKGEKNGEIWEKWEADPHSKAMESLDPEKGENTNPECLRCHTTGYGAGGYGAEGMEELDLANVGCEACHGPGSEYKSMKIMKDPEAALAAGLIVPDESTCMACHNEDSPTFKGFDFAEYWAQIEHKLPPKEEEEAPKEGE